MVQHTKQIRTYFFSKVRSDLCFIYAISDFYADETFNIIIKLAYKL